MRISPLAFLLTSPLLVLAKDCGIFYTWADESQLDVWRDLHAAQMCSDIGGSTNEVGIVNGQKPNMCAVCRGARSSTRDYERDVTQQNVEGTIKYTVRCGYYGDRKCHA
ncbi:hypothetical protein BS50DRAFT_529291 [Corynespora cassiicola Philippines]|uniref:Uncharacterized protein n=1 Tax=Corynespora cassiicola Philippines TaxID=1448308 RepID=A0A2T2NIA5_CORCC|nr:hypothetical protein BS50DRAFT_529291 [Corynespora cassiicola Philippines]